MTDIPLLLQDRYRMAQSRRLAGTAPARIPCAVTGTTFGTGVAGFQNP
jgi:hypothetical protein